VHRSDACRYGDARQFCRKRRTVENIVLGFTPVHAVLDPNFEPKYEEFRCQTIWDLSNALRSAFKQLDPIPQFQATAKLGEF
jgi:hypothetical protein